MWSLIASKFFSAFFAVLSFFFVVPRRSQIRCRYKESIQLEEDQMQALEMFRGTIMPQRMQILSATYRHV